VASNPAVNLVGFTGVNILQQGGDEFMIPDRILVHINASRHLNGIMAPGSETGKESCFRMGFNMPLYLVPEIGL